MSSLFVSISIMMCCCCIDEIYIANKSAKQLYIYVSLYNATPTSLQDIKVNNRKKRINFFFIRYKKRLKSNYDIVNLDMDIRS